VVCAFLLLDCSLNTDLHPFSERSCRLYNQPTTGGVDRLLRRDAIVRNTHTPAEYNQQNASVVATIHDMRERMLLRAHIPNPPTHPPIQTTFPPTYPPTHPNHLPTHLPTHPSKPPSHPPTHPPIQTTFPPTHPPIHPPSHEFTHSLTRSLTHTHNHRPPSHEFTHSLTRSLTHTHNHRLSTIKICTSRATTFLYNINFVQCDINVVYEAVRMSSFCRLSNR
jgi:hypothetical protein